MLTVQECSAYLRIKPSTLYAWASLGKIPCVRLNGLVRFLKEEIDAWVARSRLERRIVNPYPPGRRVNDEIKAYIAKLRRNGHTDAHGEIRPKSGLIGKEERDGAL